MTLADILKPSACVLWHAEKKGMQLGAGAGALICIPGLVFHSVAVNPSDDPPLVAIAKCAGVGAAIGGCAAGLGCIVKMSKIGAEGIKERAQLLANNEREMKLDRAAVIGGSVGIGLVSVRVVKIAQGSRVGVWDVIASRRTMWEMACFMALGASIGVGILSVAKLIAKEKEGEKEVVEAVAQAVEEAAAATEKGEEEKKEE